MQNNSEQNNSAKHKTFQMLEEAERKRATIRFERSYEELHKGKVETLKNPEFVLKLAHYLSEQFSGGDSEKARKVIDHLFDQFEKGKYADLAQPVLNDICRDSLDKYNIRQMQYLTKKYCSILISRDCRCLVDEQTCWFLTKSCGTFIRSGLWEDTEKLIGTLWKVRNRSFLTAKGKDTPFKSVFSTIVSKDVVEKLVQLHKTGDDKQKASASQWIGYLGEEAISYLLNRLVYSKNKDERFLLIDLISGYGEDIIKTLHVFMEEDLPWYAVRNLVILIGEIGNPDYYPIVEGYLIHPDIRVQRQVIFCIIKLGGNEVEKRLILALPVIADELKLKLIMQLSTYSGEEIAKGLLDLIDKRDSISSEIRSEMLQKICVSLRSYPYQFVVERLNEFLDEYKGPKKNNLFISIGETIRRLRPEIRHRSKEEKAEFDLLNYDYDPEAGQKQSNGIDDFLYDIEEMIDAGKVGKASGIIYEKIINLARMQEFQAAEMLRDKLLEINPDSLDDVIRAAEIIEEEKNSPTGGVQVDIWEELFDSLTSSEHDFLLKSLRSENYLKDEKIVSVSEIDPCLYFLNNGVVRMSCASGTRETFLKRLKPGDIVGYEPFFKASVWTVNISALQNTNLLVLRRDLFAAAESNYPELEDKLMKFCRERDTIPDLVKMSGRDRRDSARYPVNISINNVFLDPYGGKEGRRVIHGKMLDISRGGLSFSIRITKRENAHLLLGRQIISEINLKGKDLLKCFGLIVGVSYKDEKEIEYTVHVKFYSELEQNKVSDVLNVMI